MTNTAKMLRSFAAAIAGVYILFDLLILLCSSIVFGNTTVTMLAGDAFGLLVSVMLIVFVFKQNKIQYKALSVFPILLGVERIMMTLPAVISLNQDTAGSVNNNMWLITIFLCITYFIISVLFFLRNVSPKVTALLYGIPLIISFFTDNSSFEHFGSYKSAAPFSVNLLQILIQLSSVKGVLLTIALMLMTYSFAPQTMGEQRTAGIKSIAEIRGIFIKSGGFTTIAALVTLVLALILAVMTFAPKGKGFDLYSWNFIQNIWLLKIASLVRTAFLALFGIIGIYLAQKANSVEFLTTAKRALPLCVSLIALSEICYIIMFIAVMDDSDGEGLGTMLLVLWVPLAVVFTSVAFLVAFVTAFIVPKISLVFVSIYFAVQLTVGFGNYLSVYPSVMTPFALAESVAVVITLYLIIGLFTKPKTRQPIPTNDTTVYYNPPNNNDNI